jgi:signal transduction histidine kinase
MAKETTFPENEHNRHLERLVEICRTQSASQELEPFLNSLISAASDLINCEAASIMELDKETQQLHFLALPWFHRDLLRNVNVPVKTSVAGWVIENTKPAVIPDVSAEPRHFKGVDEAAGFITHSLMAVPIIYQGDTLGVLEVVNKHEQAHYTEEDLIILETLASQAAIAIQNNHLVSKVQHSVDQGTQLDRMKSDFIGIASHELRTPLGIILGYATFLREDIPAANRDQLDVIVRNSMRLKEIIDNLSNMDNVQTGTASIRNHLISIKHIVEEVFEAFSQEAQQKRIVMRADSSQDDLVLEGDASKITLALTNLVKNAITFTNPDGQIFIVAGSIPGYIKVSVIDDGIGIPAKDLPHIFERFYQAESHLTRTHGGMGLGLSVAKEMVEMHGGRIWAESVEGKGSNFTFLLPVKSDGTDAVNRTFPS